MSKKLPWILSVLLAAALCVSARSEPAGRGEGPPHIVIEGLEAFKNFGHQAAIEAWLKGSVVDSDNGTKSALLDATTQAEQAYGRMVGYEFIRTVPISPSIKRVFVALLFENSPLYATLDCYRTSHGWIVSQIDVSSKAPTELPLSSFESN